MKRKGPGTFIFRVAIFTAVSVFLLYGSNWVLAKCINTRWYSKDNHFGWLSKTRNRIVLIGSSTVKAGLNPELISRELYNDTLSVVNLGNMPTNPIKQYFAIEKNLEALPDGFICIIGIDPWVFSEKYYKYEPVLLPLWSWKEAGYMLAGEQFVWGCIGGQTDQLIMLPVRKPIVDAMVPPNMGSVIFKAADVNATANFDEWVSYPLFDISPVYSDYFEKTLILLRKKHATVILYYPPRRHDYLAGFNTLPFMDHFRKFIDPIVMKNGLPVINFEALYPDNKNFWKDPVHLSKEGVDTTSFLLMREVRRIISSPKGL